MMMISGNPHWPFVHKLPVKFIYLFFLLGLMHAALFFPLYFTKIAQGNFFSLPDWYKPRDNPDIFRWSLDYALLGVITMIGFRFKKHAFWIYLLSACYLGLLLFQTYYFISWKIYGEKPVWSYDWALIQRVLPVLMRAMKISPVLFNLIAVLVLILIYIGVYRFHQYVLRSMSVSSSTYLTFMGIAVLIIPWGLHLAFPKSPSHLTKYPAVHWIAEDIQWTFTESRIKPLADIGAQPVYSEYLDLPIKSKPNIYLIFIEAYGSIAGAVDPFQQAYWERLKVMESRLSDHQWSSASTLSNSTILGGRSWLGFTSFMSGIRIDNHPAYEKLIQEHNQYPQLIRVLNQFGYHTYRLNTMANFGLSFEKLDSVSVQFFANKTWTKYSDLPYQGYRYDYFGGIPDQFALNYWDEYILNKQRQPYFLFFITLNTHAPFYLPPPLVENWKDLNSIKTSPHGTTRSEDGDPAYRYVQDVLYNLAFLEKYIMEKADSNSLFILVGDHQPAGMEYLLGAKTDTYATPMHIITRDIRWIEALKKKGFNAGMSPAFKKGSLMKHEGFYSFFMQTWSEIDSVQPDRIPRYLPDGLQ